MLIIVSFRRSIALGISPYMARTSNRPKKDSLRVLLTQFRNLVSGILYNITVTRMKVPAEWSRTDNICKQTNLGDWGPARSGISESTRISPENTGYAEKKLVKSLIIKRKKNWE